MYVGSSLSWYLPGSLEPGGIHGLAETYTYQNVHFDQFHVYSFVNYIDSK